MATARNPIVRLVVAAAVSVLALASGEGPAAADLPDTDSPVLTLVRTIRTTPFAGTSSSMRDGEDAVLVPNDPAHPNIGGTDSLWLIEDNGHAAWEIDPVTGALKSDIRDATWRATRQYDATTGTGSGATAGSARDADLEALAYDRATDTLYAFNGKCCTSSVLPTAFRLRRGADHTFHPESFQALPSGSDFTAAAWEPRSRSLYVGVGSDLRTYDYPGNATGSSIHVSGVSGILGMSFSETGDDLVVVNSSERLLRADWATRQLRSGWSLDLRPFGLRDPRGVAVVGDQFFVLDGYDDRPSGDPLRYAVFVLEACCRQLSYTVTFSATEISSINQAADYFGVPRADALRHGARIVRFIDALTQPGGLGPFDPPPPSPGPATLTATYTDPGEVAAMEQLAARTGVTMTELHDVGADYLMFLWWVNTH